MQHKSIQAKATLSDPELAEAFLMVSRHLEEKRCEYKTSEKELKTATFTRLLLGNHLHMFKACDYFSRYTEVVILVDKYNRLHHYSREHLHVNHVALEKSKTAYQVEIGNRLRLSARKIDHFMDHGANHLKEMWQLHGARLQGHGKHMSVFDTNGVVSKRLYFNVKNCDEGEHYMVEKWAVMSPEFNVRYNKDASEQSIGRFDINWSSVRIHQPTIWCKVTVIIDKEHYDDPSLAKNIKYSMYAGEAEFSRKKLSALYRISNSIAPYVDQKPLSEQVVQLRECYEKLTGSGQSQEQLLANPPEYVDNAIDGVDAILKNLSEPNERLLVMQHDIELPMLGTEIYYHFRRNR